MHKVKFRAWFKRYKLMSDWGDIKESLDLVAILTNPRYVVMEYVGLKDKHGKEIYEGDIVKATAPEAHRDSDCVSDIIRDTTDTSWAVRSNSGGDTPHTFGLHVKWWAELEVIGNIYQNKELLDAKT
jgi:uncharacterized phage protein (TIGR01671 family)